MVGDVVVAGVDDVVTSRRGGVARRPGNEEATHRGVPEFVQRTRHAGPGVRVDLAFQPPERRPRPLQLRAGSFDTGRRLHRLPEASVLRVRKGVRQLGVAVERVGRLDRVGRSRTSRRRAGPKPPDQPFEQAGRGESVRAVDARAGALAGRVEPVERRVAAVVDRDSAAQVVFRGRDRDAVVGVDTPVRAQVGEVRKRHLEVGVERGDVEPDLPGSRSLVGDSAGDDVARGEFGVVVDRGQKPLAGRVSEDRPLPPDRLAHQERVGAGVCGRVKLHVLHVRDPGARERRHRDPVAGRAVGVGGGPVTRPDPASREDGRAGEHGFGSVVTEHRRAVDATFVRDQFQRHRVVEDGDTRALVEVLKERPEHV